MLKQKKIPAFRGTQPYLNLLVKLRIFSGFLKKNIILCILKGEMPFKKHKFISRFIMHKTNFFSRKKIQQQNMWACPT